MRKVSLRLAKTVDRGTPRAGFEPYAAVERHTHDGGRMTRGRRGVRVACASPVRSLSFSTIESSRPSRGEIFLKEARAMVGSGRNDPYGGFNFLVEIDDVTVAGFAEASGLDSETEVIEYREGNQNTTVLKLPGLQKFTNITLKRGYTGGTELWEWRKTVLDGQTDRRSGSIVLLNEAREPVIRWNFFEGWPAALRGPILNAATSDVAIETLEIAHERLEMESQ